jgi:ribokinase
MSTEPCVFVICSFVVACCARVAQMPVPGESAAARSVLVEPGGKGFNVALGLHRLGIPVRGILATGSDTFADLAERSVARFGLNGIRVLRKDGRTGVGVGISDEAGDNRVAIDLGANLLLEGDDMAAGLGGASLLMGQFETCDEVLVEGFAKARASAATTVLNPSPFRSIPDDLLSATSVLIVNQVEAELVARQLGLHRSPWQDAFAELAEHVLARGPEVLIITMGAQGLYAYRGSGPAIRMPAFPTHCVDPLGAGDAFTAAFCAALLRGDRFEDCLREGLAAGAFCVQRHGVLDGLPSAGELRAFLSQAERALEAAASA